LKINRYYGGYVRKLILPILIGSWSDEIFLREGLIYLEENKVLFCVEKLSVHRTPAKAAILIPKILSIPNILAAIGVAATATGLPGIMASYVAEMKLRVQIFGVRASKHHGLPSQEDREFNLSAMPQGQPLAYAGYNNKGFLHACIMAHKLVKF